jgi:hypothetical protein
VDAATAHQGGERDRRSTRTSSRRVEDDYVPDDTPEIDTY